MLQSLWGHNHNAASAPPVTASHLQSPEPTRMSHQSHKVIILQQKQTPALLTPHFCSRQAAYSSSQPRCAAAGLWQESIPATSIQLGSQTSVTSQCHSSAFPRKVWKSLQTAAPGMAQQLQRELPIHPHPACFGIALTPVQGPALGIAEPPEGHGDHHSQRGCSHPSHSAPSTPSTALEQGRCPAAPAAAAHGPGRTHRNLIPPQNRTTRPRCGMNVASLTLCWKQDSCV